MGWNNRTRKTMKEWIGTKEISFETTPLTANMEDYIETIANLSGEKKIVRVKDIAKRLDIKMPSVTNALNKLKEKSLINYEKYGYVELTPKGKKIAEKVCNKHNCLADFFSDVLQMSSSSANEEACKVEHHLSPTSMRQIHRLIQFFKSEDESKKKWVNDLRAILEELRLSDLKEGDAAEIIKLSGTGDFRKRLIEMGFRKGVRVDVIKYAPLKDPMLIEIKDCQVSLRVEEAKSIIVKFVEDSDIRDEE
jgi:DtxR family Mn-dependent transcriptional regulator